MNNDVQPEFEKLVPGFQKNSINVMDWHRMYIHTVAIMSAMADGSTELSVTLYGF